MQTMAEELRGRPCAVCGVPAPEELAAHESYLAWDPENPGERWRLAVCGACSGDPERVRRIVEATPDEGAARRLSGGRMREVGVVEWGAA